MQGIWNVFVPVSGNRFDCTLIPFSREAQAAPKLSRRERRSFFRAFRCLRWLEIFSRKSSMERPRPNHTFRHEAEGHFTVFGE